MSSWGDVVTDPVLPIIGTDTRSNIAQLGYQHGVSLAGRSATVLVSAPYVWRTTVGGVLKANLQRNSRVGATLVVPVRKRHAVKMVYSTGVVTESGGDFSSVQLNYLIVFP